MRFPAILMALSVLIVTCVPMSGVYERPGLSDGDTECTVLSECRAIWSDGKRVPGDVCKCMSAYKHWNVDCQQGFQKLTSCLSAHGCSLLDCYWGLSDDQVEYCEYVF